MNDFVVSIDKEKFEVVLNNHKVKVNDSEYNVEISHLSPYTYLIKINNKVYHITTNKLEKDKYSFLIDGHYFETIVRTKLEEEIVNVLSKSANNNGNRVIKSPMPGLVLRINKNVGDQIEEGEPLILLEAMKMENEIRSPSSGIVSEIYVQPHSSVEKNQTLLTIK